LTPRGVEKMRDRERVVGLEADDEAARWLGEHDPAPLPATPKSAYKSTTSTTTARRSARPAA